jgi:O-6-methylguanine DNA methyltransferase
MGVFPREVPYLNLALPLCGQITGRGPRASIYDDTLAVTFWRAKKLMKQASYCIFETRLGACGIAWREAADSGSRPAVVLLQLPEATPQATESRIARKSGSSRPSVPPPRIDEIIEKIRRHLHGEVQDFRGVTVDLDGVAQFARQVYEAAREIPPGQTRTYGEIAKILGQPAAAQEVGQALSKNPVPIIIPCHRVAAAGGKPGGFSAHGGRATKFKLLALEGASVNLPLFS